ncbi:hypothetical protein NJC38_07870 [Pseudomonas sp. 21LCFQ010]|uniref:hypothetical protein n=1 Tax=Pseudomonas sp. 21LCFQ010 TaxID=2957506 RepID=UPI0020970421|nr:hypothetical protein [Pseudomonas sp. 21LCFQ010]MCO8162074.1 hypothetical protein [Pseudomonas sp. 21LCFQ010]
MTDHISTSEATLKDNQPLTRMTWSDRRTDAPPNEKAKFVFTYFLAWLAQCSFITWVFIDNHDDTFHLWITGLIVTTICSCAFAYEMLRKTQFSYIIHTSHGEETKQLKHSPHTRFFFKTFANFAILTLIGAAIYFMSFLPFLIFFIVSLPTLMRLKNWQPPPAEHHTSEPWSQYHLVTVDRKYSIIVLHVENPTVGFETRFPNKALFEQYLTFLQTVLPPTAQYTEKVWEW